MILRLCDQCDAEGATKTSVQTSWSVVAYGSRVWNYTDIDLCDDCANGMLWPVPVKP